MYAVNRLYNLFVVNGNKYDEFKRKINELNVHDNSGNEVPVLYFKSFKDGNTTLDAAKSLQNEACLKHVADEGKANLKLKGEKVEKIILSIQAVNPEEGGTSAVKKTGFLLGGKSKKRKSKRRPKSLRSKTRRRRV